MNRPDSCVFPVVTAVLTLSYHALLAALCTYLPRNCLVLGYGLAGYASAGCAASLLGIYGIVTVSSRKCEVLVLSTNILLAKPNPHLPVLILSAPGRPSLDVRTPPRVGTVLRHNIQPKHMSGYHRGYLDRPATALTRHGV